MAKRGRKKRRNRVAVLCIALFVLLLAAGGTVFVLAKRKVIFINRWLVNEKASTIGVDISAYQADVDMEKLMEQGVAFIFMKATEGTTHRDRRFAENWENAERAGLPAGPYHFFSFNSAGATQAENFIETVGPDLHGRLLPVVDVELYGGKVSDPPAREDVVRELGVFMEAVREQYGVLPMIYTTAGVYRSYIRGAFDDCRIWIASVSMPADWSYGGEWDVWQYYNRAVLEGYSGGEKYIDMNVLNPGVSLEELTVP